MAIVKLRTEVLDERGQLGALASAIAAYGGNILGIDVHLLDGARVADEFVIEFPGDHAARGLETSLRRAGGTQFLLERVDEPAVLDPLVRALDVCARLASGPDGLEACVADLVGADAVRAADDGGPPDHGGPPWVLVVADPRSPGSVLVVERRAPAFSSSEIARISALLRVVEAVMAGQPS